MDQIEFKALAAEVKAVETENPNGEFEAILSTAVEDRDGESIAPRAFEPLPKSIPIYYQHDWMDKALPIGKGEPFYDGDVLKIKGVYGSSARAQEVRQAVTEGLVDAMSVGFVNGTKKSLGNRRKSITKGDLFESSFTGIPVNPTATVLASKAVKAGARNSATDSARLQQIHDLSVDNGASCSPMKSIKAIAGTLEAQSERIRDALIDRLAPNDDTYIWVRGTFTDHVIYDVSTGSESETFSVTYTDDGTVVTITGDPTEVDVEEVVVPEADAAADAAEDQTEAPEATAAAPAAKSAGAAAVAPDDAEEMDAARELYSSLVTSLT